ncbi:MAG: glutamine--fructose-6-phosphate aminotransferase, partial [Planctomycetota bacterium]
MAYIGPGACRDILLAGLSRLEYRGYDSAGIALLDGGLRVAKCAGRIRELAARTADLAATATVGIGHTRWATHGGPSDANAHPHVGSGGTIALVHNGIIENYSALKTSLIAKGRTFRSQTDSEVLVQLIEEILTTDPSL